MAGAVNFTVKGLAYTNGPVSVTIPDQVVSASVAGKYVIRDLVSVATTDTVLSLGSIGTPGYVYFRNNDGTNYVQIGADGSSYPIQVDPLKTAGPFKWNGAAIHAKAHTAACDVERFFVEL